MINQLLEITATHKKTNVTATMFYSCIVEARQHNPHFKHFRAIGLTTTQR